MICKRQPINKKNTTCKSHYHLYVVIGSLDVRRRAWRHLSVVVGSARSSETLIPQTVSLDMWNLKKTYFFHLHQLDDY